MLLEKNWATLTIIAKLEPIRDISRLSLSSFFTALSLSLSLSVVDTCCNAAAERRRSHLEQDERFCFCRRCCCHQNETETDLSRFAPIFFVAAKVVRQTPRRRNFSNFFISLFDPAVFSFLPKTTPAFSRTCGGEGEKKQGIE